MILQKSAFFPVNGIFQPVSNRTFFLFIFFQRLVIDHDLPACAAGILTF